MLGGAGADGRVSLSEDLKLSLTPITPIAGPISAEVD